MHQKQKSGHLQKNLFAQPQNFLADGQMNELRRSGEKVFVQSESFYQI